MQRQNILTFTSITNYLATETKQAHVAFRGFNTFTSITNYLATETAKANPQLESHIFIHQYHQLPGN